MATFLLISLPACSALSWEVPVSLSAVERGDRVVVAAALTGEVTAAVTLAAAG